MTKIEELEVKVARLEADVRWLKSALRSDKPVAYNSPWSNPCSEILLPNEYSETEKRYHKSTKSLLS